MMDSVDNKYNKLMEMDLIKSDNVKKRDGDSFTLTNLSFIEFPTKSLRDKFVAGMKDKNSKDGDNELKFKFFMTDSQKNRDAPRSKQSTILKRPSRTTKRKT